MYSNIFNRNNIRNFIKIEFLIFTVLFFFNNYQVFPANKKLTIVPLSANTAQICYALGLKDNILYIPSDLQWPQELTTKPKLTNEIAPKKIISLNPGLVLADKSSTPPKIMAEFINAGLDVKITSNDTIDEIYKTISLIGKSTKTTEKSDKLIKDMKNKLDLLKKIIADTKSNPKVLMIVNTSPITIPQKGSLLDELIRIAGGDNITSFTNNNNTLENILNVKPDIIIELVDNPSDERQLDDVYKRWAKYKNVPAAKNGNIKVIPGNELLVASHRIVEGAIILASAIHPDKREEILNLIRNDK